jgi:hypothetical protein
MRRASHLDDCWRRRTLNLPSRAMLPAPPIFEGAGLDGVMAKLASAEYQPGKSPRLSATVQRE